MSRLINYSCFKHNLHRSSKKSENSLHNIFNNNFNLFCISGMIRIEYIEYNRNILKVFAFEDNLPFFRKRIDKLLVKYYENIDSISFNKTYRALINRSIIK